MKYSELPLARAKAECKCDKQRGDQSREVLQRKGFITKNTIILLCWTFQIHAEYLTLLSFTQQIAMAGHETHLCASYCKNL